LLFMYALVGDVAGLTEGQFDQRGDLVQCVGRIEVGLWVVRASICCVDREKEEFVDDCSQVVVVEVLWGVGMPKEVLDAREMGF
jgi:hypothetical protein